MRHEAGMTQFSQQMELADSFPANLAANAVGRVIEQQPGGPGRREYHAITRGYILQVGRGVAD